MQPLIAKQEVGFIGEYFRHLYNAAGRSHVLA